MATNMYINFEDPALPATGQMEILSWNHGFDQPDSRGSGRGQQASHSNLGFTKYLDDSSAELLKATWSGKQFGKATLSCYRSGPDNAAPVKYLTILMQHVIISNLSISGGPGNIPVENVSLEYGIVEYVYQSDKVRSSGEADVRAR